MTQKRDRGADELRTMEWRLLTDSSLNFDTDVEVRATDDERRDHDPKRGATFVATDTRKVYRGDGTAWNHMGHVVEFPTDISDAQAGAL